MPRAEAGAFSLVEVLVTLVVLSIGLLGVAGLQLTSKLAIREAAHHTAAARLATDFLGRARSNPAMRATYAPTVALGLGGATRPEPVADCSAAPCSPAELAQHDLFAWERALDEALPDPTAVIGGADGFVSLAISWHGADGARREFSLTSYLAAP